jgi:hypothetical protein
MKGSIGRQGRMVWCFLLLVAAACLASGNALATCSPGAGTVPCYMTVQPIDVANTQSIGVPPVPTVVYSPFNTLQTVNPNTAGLPLQTLGSPPPIGAAAPTALVGTSAPSNSLSSNPIGFVVDPTTGLTPGQPNYPGSGVDVTRALLNNLGIELVWLPMKQYAYPACPTTAPLGSCVPAAADFTTLNVSLVPSTNPKRIPDRICTGSISGTTLTITTACTVSGTTTPATLAVYDFLSGTGITSGTYISGLLTGGGSGGLGTYNVNTSQTVKKPISITATASTLTSDLSGNPQSGGFKTLSQQDTTVTTPKAISLGGTPAAPRGGPNMDQTVVNLFFVNTLNPPPAIGGTLFGLAWICNNGVAISSQTFAQGRPDTIAHELLHNLCLDHGTYGAGPWTPPPTAGSPYAAPFGVVPTIPGTPVPGQCDSNYAACGLNLMSAGIIRTEPTLACILNGLGGVTTPGCSGLPSLPLGTADQVTSAGPSAIVPNPPLSGATSAQLPVNQQGQAVAGQDLGQSGLLFNNTNSPLTFSGLLNPIPQETTKAQLGTGGSSTDRAIFDLSAPAGGKPGETLLGWVLTLPQEQTFARHDRFHVVSQSRKDLVQDVKYYPGPGDNALKRNIAYQPGGDNNADNPSITAVDLSPCAFATAECLVVKFQPPGLGADDSISFSNSILSGDAPITNEDLCKAKITYIFSDGYVTTSNFGRCPPASLPLIASSWHPDPYVAPHVVQSNLLLADGGSSLGCTPDKNTGQCPPTDESGTSIADSDALQDAGAPQQSCDGGATLRGSANNPVTGTISGPEIIIQGGQTCHYQGPGCEFLGSLTINNATAYLKDCQVDGLLTMNSGTLHLEPDDNPAVTSVLVKGVTQIGNPHVSTSNSFSIGPGANFQGGLTVQNLSSGGLGYVCGSTFVGGVSVNSNASTIDIGQAPPNPPNQPPPPTCGGNTISGGLSCKSNSAKPIGGQNTITPSGGATGDCKGF